MSKNFYLSDNILQVRAEEQRQVLHYFLHRSDDTQEKQFIPVGNIMITFSMWYMYISYEKNPIWNTLTGFGLKFIGKAICQELTTVIIMI